MKKTFKRVLLLTAVFLVVVIAAAAVAIYRNRGEESQGTLKAASYPVIRLIYEEENAHVLHGYGETREALSVRDSITPLGADRSLPMEIETHGQQIRAVSYQVRSLDGSHLIEDTQVNSFQQQDDRMTANLQISNLIEENTEYVLSLQVDTDAGSVYYYSRVIYGTAMYTGELLRFAKDFSDATFDSGRAADFGIAGYLQTDSSIGASDFSYTNIHSTKAMVTWGDWKPQRVGAVSAKITELDETQMSVVLSYQVQSPEDSALLYDVEEFFCVRYRNERVYLLDYQRTLHQEFTVSQSAMENGSLLLGITDRQCQVEQVQGEKTTDLVAFAYDGQLWSYQPNNNQFKQIFSFQEDTEAIRDSNLGYEIQIVHAAANGDVDFMVYGYMERGDHEGSVGISFYRYQEESGTLEEKFFIPVAVSSRMLCSDLGELTYVNENDMCYFLYESRIYSVDLVSGECLEVTNRARTGMYAKNDRGNLVAWQDGEDETFPDRIQVLNMDTGEITSLSAGEGEYVKLSDFIEDDLVYGVGRISDAVEESGVITEFPLYAVEIVNAEEQMAVETRYEAAGIYIMEAQVSQNQVAMKRATKGEDGSYQETADDRLLLNYKEETEETALVKTKTSDAKKREYYLNLGMGDGANVSVTADLPQIKKQSDAHRIVLPDSQEGTGGYYVYAHGGFLTREGSLSEAVTAAYDNMGVVVDSSQTYLWTRNARDVYKTLSLGLVEAASNEESLAAALRMVIQYEGGGQADTAGELESGKSAAQVLTDALPGRTILDLSGCTIPHLLYYINENHPVLVLTGEGSARVILGYDSTNVTVYDPFGNQTYKMTQDEASQSFAAFGNRFFSCVTPQ